MTDVTQILAQLDERHPAAGEQLFAIVYDELRRLAAAKLAHEKPGQTLQATALVHEAYLRLVGETPLPPREGPGEGKEHEIPRGHAARWNGRNHFFAAAAEAMRRILVDAARRKAALKHGGERGRESLSECGVATEAPPTEVVAVHEALDRLTDQDAVAGELVKLHYFGGFSLEDAAELLGVSRATAYRRWTYARTWLRAALEDDRGG
jgi:RNA polymerase sigma factor (sigma-70 family)